MPYLPQTLEIPPAGGATVPSGYSRIGDFLTTVSGLQVGNVSQSLRSRHAVHSQLGSRSGCGPGCQCLCPPAVQPQGPNPLGQPDRPQKPFQVGQQATDPCREALQRAGIDPDCLRQLMGRGSKTGAAKSRARKGKRCVGCGGRGRPARKRRATGPRVTSGLRRIPRTLEGPISDLSRPPTIEEILAAAPRRRKARVKARPRRRRLTASFKRELAAYRRKTSPRRAGSAGYQILSNGACYDPVSRKFVKRSLCY